MACRSFATEHESYHLLLTDVRMPRRPGIEVTHKIIESRSDIKVILMTALGGETTPILIVVRAMVLRED
jgi:CheY-like chemotaxis protein